MKRLFEKPIFRKYGKKGIIIYLTWCLIKGIIFLLAGFKFLA